LDLTNEIAREWRNLRCEDLHNSHCLPDIDRVTKLRRVRCAVHVARMEDVKSACKILVGNHEWWSLLGIPTVKG